MSANVSNLLYLVAGILFILALRGLSHPTTSRQGNLYGMIGMGIAIVTTLAFNRPAGFGGWLLVLLGLGIGGGVGAVIARRVAMTQMPQLVAIFHAGVGLAAVAVAAAALYAPQAFGIGEHRAHQRRLSVRDGARRGDRRDHVHRIDHCGGQAQRQHERQADHAAAAPRPQHRLGRSSGPVASLG